MKDLEKLLLGYSLLSITELYDILFQDIEDDKKKEKHRYRYFKLLYEGFLSDKIYLYGDIEHLKTFIERYQEGKKDYREVDGVELYEEAITTNQLTCLNLMVNELPKLTVSPIEVFSWMSEVTEGEELLSLHLKKSLKMPFFGKMREFFGNRYGKEK